MERKTLPIAKQTEAQRKRAAYALNVDWMERKRAFDIQEIERAVINRFMPAETMASDLRSALRLRAVKDEESLWLDIFALVLPILLYAFSFDTGLARALIVGVAAFCGGTSVVLRRLPPGRMSRLVYPLLRPAVGANVLGAACVGCAAAHGILLDVHLAYQAHHWSIGVTLSGIPARALLFLDTLVLALHPKALLQHREILKRLRTLDVYREDRYGYLREEALRDRHMFGYFTQDI